MLRGEKQALCPSVVQQTLHSLIQRNWSFPKNNSVQLQWPLQWVDQHFNLKHKSHRKKQQIHSPSIEWGPKMG